jgi:organic hydroperoxide reductase OsmC/OhrA
MRFGNEIVHIRLIRSSSSLSQCIAVNSEKPNNSQVQHAKGKARVPNRSQSVLSQHQHSEERSCPVIAPRLAEEPIQTDNQHLYKTEIEWTGERHGELTAQALPKLDVDAPPEFKGHDGVWTPEHLFVASVNSCFMTTFLAIAENSKLEVVKFHAEAEGTLENVEGQGLMITHPAAETDRQKHSRC